MPVNYQIFKETTDDWHPSYRIQNYKGMPDDEPMFVRVLLTTLFSGKTRVAVWGADDDGMEYDFRDEGSARLCFNHIIEQPVVTKLLLKQLGFKRA